MISRQGCFIVCLLYCTDGALTATAQRMFVSQQAVSKSMKQLEQDLGIDILARDETIALMHKCHLKSGDGKVPASEFLHRPMTLYNIIPVDTNYKDSRVTYLMYSNDADFYRAMMDKNGAIVIMPTLAKQHFFTSKKMVSVEFLDSTSVLHAAVYRKDAEVYIKEMVSMLRKGLQIK